MVGLSFQKMEVFAISRNTTTPPLVAGLTVTPKGFRNSKIHNFQVPARWNRFLEVYVKWKDLL